jgi:hypothetical protein
VVAIASVLSIDNVLQIDNDSAMATVSRTTDSLSVSLTRGEKIGGLLRDVTVPLSAVRSAEVVADGLHAPRGLRAPGLALPGRRMIGTWRARGERSMVSVRRGQPALRVRLTGQRYDTLLIGLDDPAPVADAISARLGSAR